jgi:NADH dehydrogenase
MEIVIIGRICRIKPCKRVAKWKGITVTLVDKNNYNFFAPLIYQVGGILEPSSISYPFENSFRVKKIKFRLGNY